MIRIINQQTLFQKIQGELQTRLASSLLRDDSVSLTIKTGATTLEARQGELTVRPGEDGEQLVELPQALLAQLIAA